MTPPTIQALGVTQAWSGTSWKATGYVEGIGWLAAWGPSLVAALEALASAVKERLSRDAPAQARQGLEEFSSSDDEIHRRGRKTQPDSRDKTQESSW